MLVLDTGSIAAGGVFLIANYAADHEKSRVAGHPHHVTTAVSLPNTKLLLRLYDRDPLADGRLVDTADDGRGAPLAGDGTTKKAMVRTIFHRTGDQPDSWATATEQSGWDAGASEWGTPGSIPARLLPDFGRSSISVGVPIGGIVVLVGLEIAIWIGFVDLPRLQNRAVG